MKAAIHTYYIHNGHPVDRRYFLCDTSEQILGVYEVIRLVEGVPLFLEDHFFRMERSAHLMDHTLFWTMGDFEKSIRQLVEANRVSVGNVKLLVQWINEPKGDLFACFIPHKYPTGEEEENGVRLSLLEAQRENPNAKTENQTVREKADRRIEETAAYEVLLVDRSGYVTEGSRSNFFIIENDEVITPPLRSVLPGITRGKVMEAAYEMNKKVHQRPIHKNELREAEAAFLTGTSPGVLPVNQIGELKISVDNLALREIQRAYKDIVSNYIHSHKSVLT